jgi:hypothetical protein
MDYFDSFLCFQEDIFAFGQRPIRRERPALSHPRIEGLAEVIGSSRTSKYNDGQRGVSFFPT